jgi:hypothetical protein
VWEGDDESTSIHHPPIPEMICLGGRMTFLPQFDQVGEPSLVARRGDRRTGMTSSWSSLN